eukprot:TRINITY_DN48855_c0_g1_i1.p2 TRINITY_DN48855_c0_g1~~TRINITY_DN48855_c0_g1_i1.p2  ORF type:complete len:385 (+),score=114.13 TRINITY_DN48855_c0_g1_i1:62-1156(+)
MAAVAPEEGARLLNAADATEAAKNMFRDGNLARAQGYIASLGATTDLKADTMPKQALACFLKYLVKPLIIVIMIYVWIAKQLYKVYKLLPMNVVEMVFGLALCFFGGTYFCSIAAIEAFRNFGGQVLLDELTVIWNEATVMAEASNADDQVDANKDGIMDVNQMSANELITHKAKVAMMAVKEPERFCNAIQYLMSAWISVLATLKFQFAKTVAIALGITDMLTPVIVRIFGGTLAMVMGEDLKHWVPAILINTARIAAVIIASYIQAVISSVYSGLRGGRIFAEALFRILGEWGVLDKFPDCMIKKPFDINQSYVDEVLSYALAAGGVYYQISHGFVLPFPYDLALLPLTMVEWFLRWEVFVA